MAFKEHGSNVPNFRFQKSSWNSTVQIYTVFQAVFLEHEGNSVLFPQKAAEAAGGDHSFVNYAFLCSLFGLGGRREGLFFEPHGSFR